MSKYDIYLEALIESSIPEPSFGTHFGTLCTAHILPEMTYRASKNIAARFRDACTLN